MQPKSFQIFLSACQFLYSDRNKILNHDSSLHKRIALFFFGYNDEDDHLKNVVAHNISYRK